MRGPVSTGYKTEIARSRLHYGKENAQGNYAISIKGDVNALIEEKKKQRAVDGHDHPLFFKQ
ncbi:MAG TPA: hypothetical protein VD816_01520 [Ohtaekwangia sp.]|nr:hypothetical protein [Ohtaekwangia sp.]